MPQTLGIRTWLGEQTGDARWVSGWSRNGGDSTHKFIWEINTGIYIYRLHKYIVYIQAYMPTIRMKRMSSEWDLCTHPMYSMYVCVHMCMYIYICIICMYRMFIYMYVCIQVGTTEEGGHGRYKVLIWCQLWSNRFQRTIASHHNFINLVCFLAKFGGRGSL